MIIRVGDRRQNISRALLSVTSAVDVSYAYAWDVGFYHKSGGLKKDLFIFGSTECPIKDMRLELNKRLMGAGRITMSYIDFPFHSDDYIIIKYKGTVMYRGLVDYVPDSKMGVLKLVPYSRRFKETIIDKTYAAQTAESMLQDIVTSVQTDTGISWNADLVDTGETTTYTKTFQKTSANNAIVEIMKDVLNREWGVTVNNVFTVYQNSSDVDEVFLQSFEPAYTKIKRTIDWKKIKATRYEVYRKSAGGKTTNVGQVGHGGSYPTITLENLVRKKEGKFVVDTLVGSTEALDIAYSDLQSLVIPESIKVMNFNIDRYFPVIGEKMKVQDEEEQVLRTIIDCDSTGGWTGVTSDTTDYCEGTGSLTFSSSSSGDQIVYDFGASETFRSPERLGFMLKGSITGTYLEMGVGNSSSTLFTSTVPISINTAGIWEYQDFPQTSGFRYFGLNTSSGVGGTSTVKIDQVSMYLANRAVYDGNIVKVTIQLSSQNDRLCNITLSDYDEEANTDLLRLENKVDKIDSVNQST